MVAMVWDLRLMDKGSEGVVGEWFPASTLRVRSRTEGEEAPFWIIKKKKK